MDKAFSPLIKCIEKVSEESRNRIIKNIAYPKNRNYINVTCREELYHQQFDFIKSVAKELIGEELFLIDERKSHGTEDR